MEVVISESADFISLHVTCENEVSLSWEQLQKIKDNYFADLDFFEVYPRKEEIVNKANVRHLFHKKGWTCPKLLDLEVESKIKVENYESLMNVYNAKVRVIINFNIKGINRV